MRDSAEPRVHPVTRLVLLFWLIGACKFGYLALVLFARLADAPID